MMHVDYLTDRVEPAPAPSAEPRWSTLLLIVAALALILTCFPGL